MVILQGTGASPGIVFGTLCFCARQLAEFHNCSFQDSKQEIERFFKSVQMAKTQLEELGSASVEMLGEDNAKIFDIHKMILDDPSFLETVQNHIEQGSVCAEHAVKQAIEAFVAQFSRMENPYFSARSADIDDVGTRVLDLLSGYHEKTGAGCPSGIFVGEEFSPSETAGFNREHVLALAVRKGNANSHATILARTMGIPTVIGLGETLSAEHNGLEAILDGESGRLIINPDRETQRAYKQKQADYTRQHARLLSLQNQPARTRQGLSVRLLANLGTLSDLSAALHAGAEGVGLFRSECLFFGRNTLPSEEEQFSAYRELAEKTKGLPAVVRSLDIGADKTLPTLKLPKEENPALGTRAIRLCLANPTLFKTQLRAVYRASAFGNLSLMLPLVNSVEELQKTKVLAAQVQAELQSEQQAFNPRLPLGIMIETPAAALTSDLLAKEADFFSIGTNDLTQYTLAIDRQSPYFDQYHMPPHPAVLRLIEQVCKNAHNAGIPVGICGELGANQALTAFFLELGIDSLSVIPPALLALRGHIRTL